MQENIKSEHFETISYRFLDPKLVYSEKIGSIESFSVSDSFSSSGTDQEWMKMVELEVLWMSIYVLDQKKIVMHETCM